MSMQLWTLWEVVFIVKKVILPSWIDHPAGQRLAHSLSHVSLTYLHSFPGIQYHWGTGPSVIPTLRMMVLVSRCPWLKLDG